MRRAMTILLAILVAGCGESAREDGQEAVDSCPALTVREALGPAPEGYRLARGNRRVFNAYAREFRESVGDEVWRGHEARLLVRRGRREGVGLIVVNTSERDLAQVVEELERRAPDQGSRLAVGDREGWLQPAFGGGWLAVAPTGECSLLLLTSASEALVRDAASHVGAGG